MFTNQGSQMRHLDLMFAQQNQQNQNGLPNRNPGMAAVLQRQLAQQQSQTQRPQLSQMSSIFSNMAMPPNPHNMQQSSMGTNRVASGMVSQMPDGQVQGQQSVRRPITLAEMQAKANESKSEILAGENRIRNFREQALTSHLPPESVAQEIRKVQKDMMERRQALQKIMLYL